MPQVFAISNIANIEACALSVLGNVGLDNLLPPHPLALYGTLLHHMRAEVASLRWGGMASGATAIRHYFPVFVSELEAQLGDDPSTARLLPLKKSVGRKRWNDGIHRLLYWAALQTGGGIEEPNSFLLRSNSSGEVKRGEVCMNQFGVENPIHSQPLRLIGRPDHSELTIDGAINVLDYKSGNIFEGEGNIRNDIVSQLQAYALVFEENYPGHPVYPFVESEVRRSIPWGDEERKTMVERVGILSKKYPSGETIFATELASPGYRCLTCRLRHRCGAYLESAPQWRRNDDKAQIPMDVWGLMEAKELKDNRWIVRLRDLSGRHVLIEGLSRDWELETVEIGDMLWLFNLESSEMEFRHGARVRPRNFHEHPSGPHGKNARMLQLFRGDIKH